MNLNRTRDGVLTLIGGAAVLAYVLACTSFSPDDTKVLFTSVDSATGMRALDVYDRETRKAERLFVVAGTPKDVMLRARWTPDGQNVVVLSGSNKLDIVVLPFHSREPVRLLDSSTVGEAMVCLMRPPPIIGSCLFIVSEVESDPQAPGTKQCRISRLDLRSGLVKSNTIQGEASLFGQGNRVFYLRTAPGAEAKQARLFEFGRLDAANLTCLPLFEFPWDQTGDFGPIAVSPSGTQIVIASQEPGDFRIFENGKAPRHLPWGAKDERIQITDVQFSRDGRTLYTTFAELLPGKSGAEARSQFGLLEVPLDDSARRKTLLFVGRGSASDSAYMMLQFDVSHDGKTLAVCSTLVADQIDRADLALYLVDLTHRDRKVTKIPIQAPPERVAAK